MNFWIFEFLNFWIFEFLNFWFLILNFWIFEFLNFWIFEFLSFWIYEILNFWIFEFLNFWIFEFLNFWIFDFLKFEFFEFFNFGILAFLKVVIGFYCLNPDFRFLFVGIYTGWWVIFPFSAFDNHSYLFFRITNQSLYLLGHYLNENPHPLDLDIDGIDPPTENNCFNPGFRLPFLGIYGEWWDIGALLLLWKVGILESWNFRIF